MQGEEAQVRPGLSPLLGSEDLLPVFSPLLSLLQPSEQFWTPCFGELEGLEAELGVSQGFFYP